MIKKKHVSWSDKKIGFRELIVIVAVLTFILGLGNIGARITGFQIAPLDADPPAISSNTGSDLNVTVERRWALFNFSITDSDGIGIVNFWINTTGNLTPSRQGNYFTVNATANGTPLLDGGATTGWANMSGNVLLLHLEETTGQNAVDTSGSNNNGTASKVLTNTTGRINTGFGFLLNGTGDNIKVNDSASLDLTGEFTIELWVNTSDLKKGAQTLVSKWEPGSGNFTASVSSAATLPTWQAINIRNLNSNFLGYSGAAFDGRYIYFVPYNNPAASGASGNIVRYDTAGNFTNNVSNSWQVMDAKTLSSAFNGFWGAVFDGRYVYFTPNTDALGGYHGNILRYDTTGNFTANRTDTISGTPSWQAINVAGLNANFKGYTGGVFDGRFVYFVPFYTGAAYHGNVLRYDTTGNFTHNQTNTVSGHPSWLPMDMGTTLNSAFKGYYGAVFDGRYVYFVPYLRAAGTYHGNVLRYDTTGNFTRNVSSSWQAMAMETTLRPASTFKGYIGGTFDGRFVYFVPEYDGTAYNGRVIRYDTTGSFTTNTTNTATRTSSWQVMDMGTTLNSAFKGYVGAVFDGRYVYFAPVWNGAVHGNVVRYDTTSNFTRNISSATTLPSWQVIDLAGISSNYKRFYGAIFDGRYVYFIQYATSSTQENILRYDSAAQNSSYALQYNPESVTGGFGTGGPRGATIKIANSTHAFSLSSNSNLSSGWHHIAATYDGNNLTLYIDGFNVSSKGAPGITIQTSTADLIIGAMTSLTVNNTTSSRLNATIDEVAIFNRALSASEIAAHFSTQSPVLMGNHTFAVYANDSLGNAASFPTNWFNLISSLPTIRVTDPANGSTVTTATPAIEVNVTSPEKSSFYVEIFANGSNKSYGLVQNNTRTNLTWSLTANGIYSYFIRAYDNTSHNVSEGNRTLTINVSALTIIKNAGTDVNVTQVRRWGFFNFTVTGGSGADKVNFEINTTGNFSVLNKSGFFIMNATANGTPFPDNGVTTGWQNMSGNVLLLHLDEASGTAAADSSGAGNNGTATRFTGTLGRITTGAGFHTNGTGDNIKINSASSLNLTSAFTIELWVNASNLKKGSQNLVSKWEPGAGNFTNNITGGSTLPSWQAMDMGTTLSGNYKGYVGAAFDGRYMYFAPYYNGAAYHGNVVRYDTMGNFTNNVSNSWQAMNIGALNSGFKGYQGAIFDGRYVYFVPYYNGAFHGNIVRYDTTGSFTTNTSNSWQAMNISTLNSGFKGYVGAAFDGRYVYFVPFYSGTYSGNVVRYDTTGNFTSNTSNSWQAMDMGTTLNSAFKGYYGAVFDGRYVYFVPQSSDIYHGNLVRYDTTGSFTSNATDTISGHPSWQAMNMSTLSVEFEGYAGGIFDGRYVYFTPLFNDVYHGNVLRYDTTGNFTDNRTNTLTGTPSWQVMNITTDLRPDYVGYLGAAFDGRYVYFVPYYNGLLGFYNGNVIRYDTTRNFTHNLSNSWQIMNATELNTEFNGYWGGAFDGRYVYFVPYYGNSGAHGNILRYDSAGQNSSFALQFNAEDQAGGFSGGPIGVTIKIANNTSAYTLPSASNLSEGWNHIAATYDGSNLTLYVDGVNVSSRGAPGITIQNSTADLIIGAMTSPTVNGTTTSWLNGTIDEVAIYNRSLSAVEISTHYATQTPVLMGNHTFTTYANDTAGNTDKYATQWFELATAAANTLPTISMNNTTNISIASSSPIIYIVVTDPEQNTTYAEIFANGTNKSYGLIQNNTPTSMSWSSTADGIYIYFSRAYDNSTGVTTNAVSDTNLTIIIDTTKPSIAASAQMHINQTVTNASWVANFTVTDNLYLESTNIQMDSTNYTPARQGTYSTYNISLPNANYTIAAYANDSAGNYDKIANGWIQINVTPAPPQVPEKRPIGGEGAAPPAGAEEEFVIDLIVPPNIRTLINNPIDLAVNVTNKNPRPLYDVSINVSGINKQWFNVDVPLLRYIGPYESRIVFVELTPRAKGTYPLTIFVKGRKVFKNATLPFLVFERAAPGVITKPTIIPVKAVVKPPLIIPKKIFPFVLAIAVIMAAILVLVIPRIGWEWIMFWKAKKPKAFTPAQI